MVPAVAGSTRVKRATSKNREDSKRERGHDDPQWWWRGTAAREGQSLGRSGPLSGMLSGRRSSPPPPPLPPPPWPLLWGQKDEGKGKEKEEEEEEEEDDDTIDWQENLSSHRCVPSPPAPSLGLSSLSRHTDCLSLSLSLALALSLSLVSLSTLSFFPSSSCFLSLNGSRGSALKDYSISKALK